MRNSYAVVFLCLIFCCKINAQKVSYSIRNDSIETITIERMVNKLPQDKQNVYRKAIEMAFDEFWKDSKNMVTLPLKKISNRNGEIDVLNAQIEALNAFVVEKLLERDTITLNHEIDSLKQEIAKIENAKDSVRVVVETRDNHDAEKLIVSLTDALVYGDSLKKMDLCKMDTSKMEYAIRFYPILGEFYDEDYVEMKNRYETICCYYPLALSAQQSVRYMARSIYDETTSRKYVEDIKGLIKSCNQYSDSHIAECGSICKALDDMKIQTANLSEIINQIWNKYENGFPSEADLKKANILEDIINVYVGAATNEEIKYSEYFINLNKILNYLRVIFSPDNYVRIYGKKIKNREAMNKTRQEIKDQILL